MIEVTYTIGRDLAAIAQAIALIMLAAPAVGYLLAQAKRLPDEAN